MKKNIYFHENNSIKGVELLSYNSSTPFAFSFFSVLFCTYLKQNRGEIGL